MSTKLANKTESMSNSFSDLQEESEKQTQTPLEEDLLTPEKTPASEVEEELPAQTLQDGIQLPEPDPDNITVLTGKLPNKPILPWNRYDSPWEEEEEREAQLELAAERQAELDVEEVEEVEQAEVTVAQEEETTFPVVVKSEAKESCFEEEDYVDLDEDIESDEVE